MTQPTTHRVLPKSADAWIAGKARPPGDGFEEVRRNVQRSLRIGAWVRRAIVAGAVMAIMVAIGVVFGGV